MGFVVLPGFDLYWLDLSVMLDDDVGFASQKTRNYVSFANREMAILSEM